MIKFSDIGLNPMILQALDDLEFETPTPIQTKIIPHLIDSKKDLIALAQTGTGKTAAFALPIIQQVDEKDDFVQALVLCPTRELAMQVASDIKNFTKYSKNVSVVAVYGGARIDLQIKELKKKPQIVVGTPGRLNDLINRRVLKLHFIKWLVLDEADEILDMGFKDELDEILGNIPDTRQMLLFSATLNDPVRRIASNYMKKPDEITVGNKNMGADNVQHFYYVIHEKDRYQALKRIADYNPDIHGIVFCRTRRETQNIADKLVRDGYSAEAIHGEISQAQRTNVMDRFRSKKTQLLVATDVAARGIDVSGLTHIINYNLPEKIESYVHRSGRTGRANSSGISLLIVNMKEKFKIKVLEKKIGKSFEKKSIPEGKDICEKQLFKLIERIRNTEVNEKQIGRYLDLINKKFEDLDRDELIKKFVSVEFNAFLDHYKDAVDLNSGVSKSSMLFARFSLNLGKNSGMTVKRLFAILNENPAFKNVEIGDIDLKADKTVFEVDQRFESQILEFFNNKKTDGVKLKIVCEKRGLESSRMKMKKPRGGGRGFADRRKFANRKFAKKPFRKRKR